MAEVVQEKSRGLKFAEQQLLRHGWEHGKGLGRAENGISEAIKVKVKCDKGGVGHKEGEQFTFHWWDHVFNKASSSLQVESDQFIFKKLNRMTDGRTENSEYSENEQMQQRESNRRNRIKNGIKVKKMPEDDGEDGLISNKKPRKAKLAKAKLYGRFVKSATLLSGQEQPQQKSSSTDESSSSSSDKDDDYRLDLSSTTKLSDADLVKACGGRTAHKGARHGLTMSAKLARLEQQEAEFMAKYGRKSQPLSSSPVCCKPAPLTTMSAVERAERQEETAEDTHEKKMLKKKKKKKKKKSGQSVNELNGSEASESTKADVMPKKTKKKKAKETADAVVRVENGEADCSYQPKMKRKNKNKAERNEEETSLTSPAAESSSLEETAELKPDTKMKKRKRKKGHTEEDTEFSQSELVQDQAPKTSKGAILVEEAEVKEEQSARKQKKGKFFEDVKGNEEPFNPKKKKKKSKEQREYIC